jgi:hypothetical protein
VVAGETFGLAFPASLRGRPVLLLEKEGPQAMVGFPLLLIPLAIYNIIVFLMPGVSLDAAIVKLTLMSGTEWPVTLSDILLALAALMLMFEVIKGARPGAKYFTDHLLSLIVTGAAAAEFVLWKQFGTPTYFLLTLFSLVDFITGIALRARRGTVVAAVPAASRRSAKVVQPPVAEPSFEPEPAPVVAPAPIPAAAPVVSDHVPPPAASVAESVLRDHPEPTPAPPVIAPAASSPEVASPDLQPGHGVTPPDAPPR